MSQAEIDALKEHIQKLEIRIEALQREPGCPKCGGVVRPSTRYGTWFCQQEFGHCGYLVLHPVYRHRGQGEWPKAHFTRTSCDSDGKIRDLSDYAYEPFLLKFFVAGQEVTKEDYFSETQEKAGEA